MILYYLDANINFEVGFTISVHGVSFADSRSYRVVTGVAEVA